jgi:hypothetical protein
MPYIHVHIQQQCPPTYILQLLCAFKVAAGYVLHIADVSKGVVSVGSNMMVKVDYERRDCITPNHTFTHVLNFALRCARIVQPLFQPASRNVLIRGGFNCVSPSSACYCST